MKNILFLLITVGLISLTSCNKNQKVVKNLEGTWTVTQLIQNDSVISLKGIIYTLSYESCKLNKEESCPGFSTVTEKSDDGGFTYTYNSVTDFSYSIEEKTLFSTTYSSTTTFTTNGFNNTETYACNSNCTKTMTILEHTDSKLVLEEIISDSLTVKITAEK